MSVQNEKLIEEAKHLIEQAGSFREQVGDDASPTSMIGLWLRTADALHAALAVFENAHTPECEMCRWENGFGARKPLTHTCEKNLSTDDFPHGHPEMDPTDDEVEALRIAHLDARQAAYRKEREDWFVDHEAEPEIATNAFFRGWDAAVGGGFRRSAQVRAILTEAHRVWFGIERGTHTHSDLDQVLDPSRWSVNDREGETHD